MLNIGTLDRYCEVVSRNVTINADGSVSVVPGDEVVSKGFIYCRQSIKSSSGVKIASGLADDTNLQWLARYSDVLALYINPGDYIKFNFQFYRINDVTEATEFGRNRGAYINTTIMNRVSLVG